ncbi:MAG TPA: S-layer homology domain-containing protein, partial [Thermoanaerobaculia bacterium]|nr:S-layer homology domain-containing protein [Thermoanaerobaculia bacterium]
MKTPRLALAIGVLAAAVSSLVSAQTLSLGPAGVNGPPHSAKSVADPPCGPTSISQSTDPSTVTPSNSISCNSGPPNFFHADNHYFRAMDLTSFGITGDFEVCQVTIGVQEATSGGGTGQPMTVNLYTWATFPSGSGTLIGTADVTVLDQQLTLLGVPVAAAVPAGSTLVVEIFTPSGIPDSNRFFIGSNTAGQSAPSYLEAAGCGIPTPVTFASLDHPDVDIVMTVIGQTLGVTPAALNVDLAGNGVLELGETVTIAPSWKNETLSTVTVGGTADNLTGPSGLTYSIADITATYGSIASGATANCADSADCYSMEVTGMRPNGHVDLTFDEFLLILARPTGGPNKTWTLHLGGSFADVPSDDQFYKYVETIFHNGVTGGCGLPGDYCPGDTTLRKQMAVFLLKSKLGATYAPPACTGTVFLDVPCTGGVFDPWIEDLAGRGITGGCGNGDYCPENPVTRAQMAVFLLKADQGSAYTPPACTGTVFL